MKTKALLLTVALGAAGAATSMAQVYSQNAVGYINLSVPVGPSLIANQLKQVSYLLTSLIPTAPANTLVFKFDNGSGLYSTSIMDEFGGGWLNNGVTSTDTIDLGGGVWIITDTAFTVTLVGEVPQGTLTTPTPLNFSIVSSQVPQAGDMVTDLGFSSAGDNDVVFRFIPNANPALRRFDVWQQDEFDHVFKKDGVNSNPSMNVGEAVILQRATSTGPTATWVRTFSVN